MTIETQTRIYERLLVGRDMEWEVVGEQQVRDRAAAVYIDVDLLLDTLEPMQQFRTPFAFYRFRLGDGSPVTIKCAGCKAEIVTTEAELARAAELEALPKCPACLGWAPVTT